MPRGLAIVVGVILGFGSTLCALSVLRAHAPWPGDLTGTTQLEAEALAHLIPAFFPADQTAYIESGGRDPVPQVFAAVQGRLIGRVVQTASSRPSDAANVLSISIVARPLLGVAIVNASTTGCWADLIAIGHAQYWMIVSIHRVCR